MALQLPSHEAHGWRTRARYRLRAEIPLARGEKSMSKFGSLDAFFTLLRAKERSGELEQRQVEIQVRALKQVEHQLRVGDRRKVEQAIDRFVRSLLR